jgi:hypothetical protein
MGWASAWCKLAIQKQRDKETYPQHVVQLLGIATEGYLVHEALKVVQGMAAASLLAFNLHLCLAPGGNLLPLVVIVLPDLQVCCISMRALVSLAYSLKRDTS